jgi:hypothetical protein
MAAIVILLVTDHADSVRATPSVGTWSSRYAPSTGLNTPMQAISPSSTTMTSTSPLTPGWTNASPTGQQARSTPATRRT